MRILHAAETVKGGVATVISLLASAHNNEFPGDNIYALIPNGEEFSSGSFPGKIISWRKSGRNVYSLIKFAYALARAIFQYRPDVVHLHSSFAGAIGRVVCIPFRLWFHCGIVYSPHAFSFLMSVNRTKKGVYSCIERVLYDLCDAIICVSNWEYHCALKCGLRKEKMHVIHNGINIHDRVCPTVNPFNDNDSGVTQLLFVGRFDFQKGFDCVIDLIKRLDPSRFHLTVIGDFVVEKRRRKADNRNYIPDGVTRIGWMNSRDLGAYYQYADVVLTPSRWEGFAMVPIEALSYATPVISSRHPSFMEIIHEGENGFVFDFSADDIVQVLTSTTKKRWVEMGATGRELVRLNFSSDRMFKQTYAVYVECCYFPVMQRS